jgi:hypothetical protein
MNTVLDNLRHLRSMLDDLRLDVKNGTWNGDSSTKLRACIDITNASLYIIAGPGQPAIAPKEGAPS